MLCQIDICTLKAKEKRGGNEPPLFGKIMFYNKLRKYPKNYCKETMRFQKSFCIL